MNGLSVHTNLASMTALMSLNTATRGVNASMERLATGQRVNRASDDPAAAISGEGLKAREKSIHKQLDAMDFEEHQLGAREGVYGVLSDMFIDLRGLVTQAANTGGTSPDERDAIQLQIDGIVNGVNAAIDNSTFDGKRVLEGMTAAAFGRQTKYAADGSGTVVAASFSLADLTTNGKLNVVNGDVALASLVADAAVQGASDARAGIGLRLKGMDSDRKSLVSELEGITSEKSRLLDTDYASETAALVRQQILQAAAIKTARIALTQQQTTLMTLIASA